MGQNHYKKVGFADSIFSGRLSCYSGNIVSDISYIIKNDCIPFSHPLSREYAVYP